MAFGIVGFMWASGFSSCFLVYLLSVTSTRDIGEVGFAGPTSGRINAATIVLPKDVSGYPFHFRLCIDALPPFHFGFYFADAVPVRMEIHLLESRACPEKGRSSGASAP